MFCVLAPDHCLVTVTVAVAITAMMSVTITVSVAATITSIIVGQTIGGSQTVGGNIVQMSTRSRNGSRGRCSSRSTSWRRVGIARNGVAHRDGVGRSAVSIAGFRAGSSNCSKGKDGNLQCQQRKITLFSISFRLFNPCLNFFLASSSSSFPKYLQ